jgi:hypothetical protein
MLMIFLLIPFDIMSKQIIMDDRHLNNFGDNFGVDIFNNTGELSVFKSIVKVVNMDKNVRSIHFHIIAMCAVWKP